MPLPPAPAAVHASARADADGTYSFLFYGTLITPGVLSRVIGHAGSNVRVRTAVLPHASLHPVSGADYPGLVLSYPADDEQRHGGDGHSRTSSATDRAASPRVVRGTLVQGLSASDARYLDLFEGDEYRRTMVQVFVDADEPSVSNESRLEAQSDRQALAALLAKLTPEKCAEMVVRHGSGGDDGGGDRQTSETVPPLVVEANVYEWADDASRLDQSRDWRFEDFVLGDRASLWVQGSAGGSNREWGATSARWAATKGTDASNPEAAAAAASDNGDVVVDENLLHIERSRHIAADASGADERNTTSVTKATDSHAITSTGAPAAGVVTPMNVGVDPWADPVPSQLPAAARVTSANPWVSDSPRPGSPALDSAGAASARSGVAEGSAVGAALDPSQHVGPHGHVAGDRSVHPDSRVTATEEAKDIVVVETTEAAMGAWGSHANSTQENGVGMPVSKSNGPAVAAPTPPRDVAAGAEGTTGVDDEEDEAFERQLGLPRLGHDARRYFLFRDGFTNLNNGSFGAVPKMVRDRFRQLQDMAEENIDLFRFKMVDVLLASNRARLATLLRCDADEIAIVANATTATNAVLRDLALVGGDCVVLLSIGYGAVVRTLRYLQDNVRLSATGGAGAAADVDGDGHGQSILHEVVVPVDLEKDGPEQIVSRLRATLRDIRAGRSSAGKGARPRIAIFDAISSMPAAVLPWREMVAVCKEENVLSLVDAAHAIGQIELDVKAAGPDFLVTNAHKWLYAHRGAAVLYVPKSNRRWNRSALPTSWEYKSLDEGGVEKNGDSWGRQWGFVGTIDMSGYLSVEAGIDFAESLGGVPRIMRYNHRLARDGGEAAAAVLGTEMVPPASAWSQGRGCCMCNVRLPLLASRVGRSQDEVAKWLASGGSAWFWETLQYEYRTAIPIVAHSGKLWARFSAQIWLEKSDLQWGARALLELCRRINSGEVDPTAAKAEEAQSGNAKTVAAEGGGDQVEA